jgi:hypothetical protein
MSDVPVVVDPTDPDPVPSPDPVDEPGLSGELEALLARPGFAVLEDGTEIPIKRMKVKQFLALLEILVQGGGPMLPSLYGMTGDEEEFGGTLGALLLLSLPVVPELTMKFVQGMIDWPEVPGPFKDGVPISEEGRQAQADLISMTEKLGVGEDMEIDTFVSVVQGVVIQEMQEFKTLGKRVRQTMALAAKIGKFPKK